MSKVGVSLLILPSGIFVGAIAILFSPHLWSAILIRIADGSLKQSINKSGIELLALPIPTHIKNQAKTFIDVVGEDENVELRLAIHNKLDKQDTPLESFEKYGKKSLST